MKRQQALERQHELSRREIELPGQLGSRDVRVRIHMVGICGSDAHYYTHGRIGPMVVKEPMVLGHEASGTATEVGDRVCMVPGISDMASRAAKLDVYNVDPSVRFWATPPVHGCLTPEVVRKEHLAFWIISTRMAPIAAVIVPLYMMFRYLNLLDSYTGLIIAYLSFNLPFAIWLMTAFFDDLPVDLEEAARIDGASKWQLFRHIALPLMKPGLVTTAILCFIFAWNDYAFATTFAGPGTQTIPIAAAQLLTQTGIDWGKLLAIGTVVVCPMAVFGLLVKRWLVTGLTLGAVK